MDGKARVTRWRAKQVAEGGKPIGVTLTPGAAQALENLQALFNCSQREVISLALEFALEHRTQLEGSQEMNISLDVSSESAAQRLEELESRLEQLEARLAESSAPDQQPTAEESAQENKKKLLAFTAKQMLEHGERMSRVQLYTMAKQHGMPVQETPHAYNIFISYHMDIIRDIMRSLKERTH